MRMSLRKTSALTLLLSFTLLFLLGCVQLQQGQEPAEVSPTTEPQGVKENGNGGWLEDCVLSLCDCECYFEGESPEELFGKLCGINCLGERGVKGCKLEKSVCVKVTT